MKHSLRLSKYNTDQPVLTLVRGDAESTSIRFEVSKTVDGVDISDLVWWVKIVTSDGQVDQLLLGGGDISGVVISFDWTLGYFAAVSTGITLFEVQGYSGGKTWKSAIYRINVVDDISDEPYVEPKVISELQELLMDISDDLPTIYSARDAATEAAEKANTAADNANESAEKLDAETGSITMTFPSTGNALRKLIVDMKIPAVSAAGAITIRNQDNKVIGQMSSSSVSTSAARYVMLKIDLVAYDQQYKAICDGASGSANSSRSTFNRSDWDVASGIVTGITVQFPNGFPVGTNIKVFGS